ncbi:double-strand break repair protein MRE11 [Anabrus simplex]|uniref:double-strand break repair protein MRE11 n=1 Tax=Anabrus simplex TaxID=316456 RepID=UPI0035A37CCB
MSSGDILPEDTFNILVATDIHLGYAENVADRGDDSFNTFEEILSIAAKEEVDFILLGGDLFHDHKPSPRCIHRCMSLIRRYCMGDRPVGIEFLSDQTENFRHCFNPVVNYEDPNLNISIPVFSIHGNHDDPSGVDRICSLDILSVSGLVNYFGKWNDLKQVDISPLLMKKGATQLALYGLSHITDDRLARLFRDQKVQFFRPKEETESWFNIFVLHQNRVNRGLNKYIPDTVLPDFLDLVIWGHEHECLVKPEKSSQKFFITQPGSPVATSLCEGEAEEKHIALLKVNKKNFQIRPIKLKTVRPFVIDTIQLSKCRLDMTKSKPSEQVQKYLEEYVKNMINRAANQISGHPKQPTLPLIRLRVEFQYEQQTFNTKRFGEMFHGKVANPIDIILMKRERQENVKEENGQVDSQAMVSVLRKEQLPSSMLWDTRVEDVVEKYFKTMDPNNHLNVLSVKGMAQAVTRYVEKDDKDAIDDIFKYNIKKTLEYLNKVDAKEDEIEKEVERFRILRQGKSEEEVKEAVQLLENKERLKGQSQRQTEYGSDTDDQDSDAEQDILITKSTSSRGRGARGRGRGRGRGKLEDNDTSMVTGRRGGRGSRGGRGAAASRKEPVAQTTIMDSFSQSSRKSSRPSSRKGVTLIEVDSDSDPNIF